jgi:hypothetical protein
MYARGVHEPSRGGLAYPLRAIDEGVPGELRLGELEPDAFWFFMDNRNWMHPFDDQGRRRPYTDLPKSVTDLSRRSVPFACRRVAPGRRIREGHDAIQRIPLGGLLSTTGQAHARRERLRTRNRDRIAARQEWRG